MRHEHEDEGQVSLLILVYCLIAAALVAVVASATAVHLVRHRLMAVADNAALAAADRLDLAAYFARGSVPERPDGVIQLTDDAVRAEVNEFLVSTGAPASFNELGVGRSTGTSDGVTAEVTLTARAQLPFVSSVFSGWAGGVPVTVTARARSAAVRA